jgi:hypothetical protein
MAQGSRIRLLESQADLELELRRTEEEFAHGDFVDLTVDELDRCVEAGKWPWQHVSSG